MILFFGIVVALCFAWHPKISRHLVVAKSEGGFPVSTSTPATEECEKTAHFSLGQAPLGWNRSVFCLRGTAIFTIATSSNYTRESNAAPGSLYGDLVLVNGARLELSADPGYPYSGCELPHSSEVLYNPITERKIISVDGYEGAFAHVQEPANPPSPTIDYYYVRIPILNAPCQMIDFVSVVSTTTDNETEFQKFLNNIKFVPGKSRQND